MADEGRQSPDDSARHRRWSHGRRAAMVAAAILAVAGLGYLLTREVPWSARDDRLRELCDRGERLRSAKLLDEAAVTYVRAEREDASCDGVPAEEKLGDIIGRQDDRSDAIENARIERLVAARLPRKGAKQHREDAYDYYLEAFGLDVRSPGARRGLRALLRAQERALGKAFEDRTCERARRLLDRGLLFEARLLSGIVQGSDPAGKCVKAREDLLKARRDAARYSSTADGLAAAGDHADAFDLYVDALTSDPSYERALDGLRRLPALDIPSPRSVGGALWGWIGSAADDVGPTVRAIVLLIIVLLLIAWLVVSVIRRRADRRTGERARRPGVLSRAIDPRYQVTTPAGLDAAEREAYEVLAEAMRQPGLLRGRPAEETIEANPRFLDTMPSESAAGVLPPMILDIAAAAGADALTRAVNAATGIFVRNAEELPTRFVPGADTVMEMQLPKHLGGGRVSASAADFEAAAPSDTRQRRNAVAQLLAERVRDKVGS